MKKSTLIIAIFIMIMIPVTGSSGYLTLNKAIELGIKNHESIKASKETEKQRGFDLKKAKSERLFNISGSYSYTMLKENPVSKTGGTEIEIGDKNNFSWSVSLSQPVFTGFALESAQKIADKQLYSSKLDTKRASLDIAYRIKKAFAGLFLAQKNLLVSQQTLISLTAHKNDAQKFYNTGLVPLNDLLKAEVSVADALQQRDTSIVHLNNAGSFLNILIGRESDADIEIKPLEKKDLRIGSFEKLKETAFIERPEIGNLATGIKILDFSREIAKSDYYPHVSLIAGYEQNGENFTADKNDYSNTHNACIGVLVSWKLFDFKQRNSKVQSRIHEKKSAMENLRELKKNIALDVETSLRNLNVARQNINTAEKGVTQARENWRITNIQYKEQTTTSTEVLNARTYLTQAETGYFNAIYKYWSALADLERSVGIVVKNYENKSL